MKTIRWTKQYRKCVVIPENCQIIISAEYNKFYVQGSNGFKLYHCDFGWYYNHVTFIWPRIIDHLEVEDNIDLLSNKRIPWSDEKIIIKSHLIGWDKAKLIIDKYEENGEAEDLFILEKEIPLIEWQRDTMQIPDECRMIIPIEYNCIYDTFWYYIRLAHYEDVKGETALTLYWNGPTKRMAVEVINKSQDFDVTEGHPYLFLTRGKFKINKKKILQIELTMTLDFTENNKLYRKLSFAPIVKPQDWWAPTDLSVTE